MGINFVKQFVSAGLSRDTQLFAPGFSADEDVIKAVGGSMLLAMPVALLAGLVSFFSPCVLPLLPGYLSKKGFTLLTLTGKDEQHMKNVSQASFNSYCDKHFRNCKQYTMWSNTSENRIKHLK